MSKLDVYMFPALSDNYCYLIHDANAGVTGVIDTPDIPAIEKALEKTGWSLTHILNTHHHADHAGGNLELKEKTGCTIVGSAKDAARIPGIDIKVTEGDAYEFGGHKAQILDVSGHTIGHIAYWFSDDGVAFVGDALFTLGCGRMFEGTPDQMWGSLQKLMALPDDTTVYCAHEYTAANAKFALSVEPHNEALIERAKEIDKLRSQNIPTVPTTIGEEKATNPFLRPASADLQATIGLTGAPLVDVFAETRRLKDHF